MIQSTLRRKQSGFSLIELLLVLGISIAIIALWLSSLRRDTERGQGQAAGEQMKVVGQALNAYIALRYDVIASHIPGVDDCPSGNACETANPADPGSRVCTDVADLGGGVPGKRCTITNETLRINGLVPNSFSGRNSWGSTYTYRITVTGATPNLQVDGMVVTDDPYMTGSTFRFDLLGEAMLAAGADSGMTRNSPTQADGYNGSWSENNERFDNINELGQLVYRAGFSAQAYNAYLRRDGALPMTGELDMGGNSISNALDIQATGTISGRNLLASGNAPNDIRFADNAGATDRAQIGTSGTGGTAQLGLRHANKVSIERMDGTDGALETGSLLATGNIAAQGTLAVTGASTLGGPVQANSTITANGLITGSELAAGSARLITNRLTLNNTAGTLYGLNLDTATNTITATGAAEGRSNLEAYNLKPQNAIFVGSTGAEEMIIQSDPTNAFNAVAGAACTNAGTAGNQRVRIARADTSTNELLQCTDGIWTTMGLVANNINIVDGPTACTVPNTGTVQNSTAVCAAGHKLISGGYRQVSGPTRSGPVSSYRVNATSWLIAAGYNDPYGVGTITAATCWVAQAVCAR